jgi:hypothetical protein
MKLDFSKFSGEGRKSTHEHISQYLAHLGELVDRETYRVRLFSLSLTSTAFAWYATLPPNSINSWEELEEKFHEHFFSKEHKLELAYLASVRQGPKNRLMTISGGSGILETDAIRSMSQKNS